MLTKLRNALYDFQERQEGEDLVQYTIVFILASIILLSTLNVLAEPIGDLLKGLNVGF